ncbi:MAG: ArsA family ATPase [Acidimicrobiales bacterium]
MDPARFFAASRLAIVAGKGGVGKTTVSAVLARAAARSGRSALVVEVEGKSGLTTVFERPELGYQESVLWERGDPPGAASVAARALTADDALVEYLTDHGLDRVSRRLVRSGALEIVSTAAPGIKDILLLGKVKQIERASTDRLVVLDTPAAGHAVSFLRAPRALLDTVSVGPINTQAREALDLLTDAARTRVLLVTIPEETPINELIETAYKLEDELGIALGPVIVNGVDPAPPATMGGVTAAEAAAEVGADLSDEELEALDTITEFRRARAELQAEQLGRLERELPLPQLHLPAIPGHELGRGELDRLSTALVAGIEALDERLTEVGATPP